jgi:hypothetical protein
VIAEINQTIVSEQLPLAHVFNAPLFTGEQRFPRPDQGREWRVFPIDEDPLFQSEQGFPFPDEVLKRLDAVQQVGINFDTFYVAHELTLQGTGQVVPTSLELLLPPPPRRVVETSAQLGSLAQQVQRLATLPLLGTLAGLTAATVVAAALTSALALDPILFGVVAEPQRPFQQGTVAAWFYIAHWCYE